MGEKAEKTKDCRGQKRAVMSLQFRSWNPSMMALTNLMVSAKKTTTLQLTDRMVSADTTTTPGRFSRNTITLMVSASIVMEDSSSESIKEGSHGRDDGNKSYPNDLRMGEMETTL